MGDVRQETWGHETEDGRQKMGDRRRETEDGRQETGDKRRETGDKRRETRDRRGFSALIEKNRRNLIY